MEHEGKYNRVLRSHQLAMRMIRLGARPSTVVAWAKVTRERAGELAHECRQNSERAPRYLRGPSPTSLAALASSTYMREELTALAGVCHWVGVLPAQTLSNARMTLPSIERGERLCDAMDIYRDMVPHSRLTMDQAVLLVTALAEQRDCQLTLCKDCAAVMLVDPLAPRHGPCSACKRETESHIPEPEADCVVDHDPSAGVQQSLF
jgi:hypothetical protein